MRLFFALWPPAAAARALSEWAREVQRGSGGRPSAEETIHLTLAFLGEAEPAKAIQAANSVNGGSFRMKVDTAKYWKHNRIIWAGPEKMPVALDGLVKDLHLNLRGEGFVLEDRPFAAHLTLIRDAKPPKSIPSLPAVAWPAADFALVRSAGGRYQTVQRFPLR
jgi:2'-5' RNA ligase